MSVSATVLLGIVSSLVATAIFLLLSKLFYILVLPWVRDQVYRGARVDGTWRYQHAKGQIYELDIKQIGDRISGEGRLTTPHENAATTSGFTISGYIADGSVLGVSRPAQKYSISHSTFCLRLRETPHEEILQGKIAVFEDDENEVVAFDVSLKRVGT